MDVKDHFERREFFTVWLFQRKEEKCLIIKPDKLYSLSEVIWNKKKSNLFTEMEKK